MDPGGWFAVLEGLPEHVNGCYDKVTTPQPYFQYSTKVTASVLATQGKRKQIKYYPYPLVLLSIAYSFIVYSTNVKILYVDANSFTLKYFMLFTVASQLAKFQDSMFHGT